MKSTDKDVCLKEISHNLLDCGEKVSAGSLSENWSLNISDASNILSKWVEQNEDVKLKKHFLLRGVDKSATSHLTIVPEHKLEILTERFSQAIKLLYSIEVGSDNDVIEKPTNIDCKSKRLRLKESYLVRANEQPHVISSTKSSIAGSKKQNEEHISVAAVASSNRNLQNGEKRNSVATMFKNVKPEPKSPKKVDMNKSHMSPQKKTPTKKSPPAKTIGSDSKKPKDMFSSFFTQKTAETGVTNQSNPIKSTIKDEPSVDSTENKESNNFKIEKNENTKKDNNNKERKRSSVASETEEDSKDEKVAHAKKSNPPKRRKVEKTNKPRSKGSRILQVVDSSDEDENLVQADDSNQKKIEEHKKEEKVLSQHNNGTTNRRVKKHRVVTRTYEDDDGFIRTVKENEEYSSSEAEEIQQQTQLKEQNPPPPKAAPKKEIKSKSITTKQGSIMSFFTKK